MTVPNSQYGPWSAVQHMDTGPGMPIDPPGMPNDPVVPASLDPGGVHIQSGPGSVTFLWTNAPLTTYYTAQVLDANLAPIGSPQRVTTGAFAVTGLGPNAPAWVRISPCNALGCSTGTVLVGHSAASAGGPPTGSNFIHGWQTSQTSASVSWDPDPQATYYQASCNVAVVVNGQTGTSFRLTSPSVTFSGLQPNTIYHFALASCNQYGCTGFYSSGVVTDPVPGQPVTPPNQNPPITPPPPPPPKLSVVSITTEGVFGAPTGIVHVLLSDGRTITQTYVSGHLDETLSAIYASVGI